MRSQYHTTIHVQVRAIIVTIAIDQALAGRFRKLATQGEELSLAVKLRPNWWYYAVANPKCYDLFKRSSQTKTNARGLDERADESFWGYS